MVGFVVFLQVGFILSYRPKQASPTHKDYRTSCVLNGTIAFLTHLLRDFHCRGHNLQLRGGRSKLSKR